MYFVYILYSKSFDRWYIDNLKRRLLEHNSGRTRLTKAFLPWEMVFNEEFNLRKEARGREKYLKTAAGRRWRKNNIRPRGATEYPPERAEQFGTGGTHQ
ncbi:MAG TPA: GIY-YIG nuclease family protein [Flavobacteriaceae bacterium]|nr:GIY-YIG nuclease family protein [Flavobacteriaceae bacterium]